MARLAEETGGGFFEVSAANSIDTIYAKNRGRAAQPVQHWLHPGSDGCEDRKLKLTATQKGLVVRTRDGYYPK